MEKKKKILLVFVVIIVSILGLTIAGNLSTRYSTSYSYEHIYKDGPIQQQGFPYLNKKIDDYVLSIYKSTDEEKINNFSLWQKDKFFRNRYQYLGDYLPIDIKEEGFELKDVEISYFDDDKERIVVVYGFNNPENPIESYIVNIDGEEYINNPKEGFILEAYKFNKKIIPFEITEIKYKDN